MNESTQDPTIQSKGKLYGIGAGPGDPELLTLKAVRILKECDVIAFPNTGEEETARRIVEAYIQSKPTLSCHFSMSRELSERLACRGRAARDIEILLKKGCSVGFVTLGDPTVYSTYLYVEERLRSKGYDTEIVSGIPSFVAAAAAAKVSLCEGQEPLHILPAQGNALEGMEELKGTLVIMKAGRNLKRLLTKASSMESEATLIRRVGMQGEAIQKADRAQDLLPLAPETPDYFSILMLRPTNHVPSSALSQKGAKEDSL
ncbi:Cobalt-precorrin-2 C20-methyltransferase [Clostridiaceae bacterium JG1575]|nr:Cobalt-precorrin-2 C20-methyltransferase [Clostridiaceae bacterium JG1575]